MKRKETQVEKKQTHKRMLVSSCSKKATDSDIGDTRSFNISSPAFKRRSSSRITEQRLVMLQTAAPVTSIVGEKTSVVGEKTSVVDPKTTVVGALAGAAVGGTSTSDVRDEPESGNEITNRFLLGLRYMTSSTPAREITFHANSGDITFGKYL